MAPKKNPNPPGTRQLTLAEVSPVVAALEVPKHLRAEFLKGFGVEWEHAHTVGYDLMLVGGIVLDHLAEDPHYYRKLQRARLNPAHKRPSERVQACFDALLSSVQEQYPSLSCTLRVDSKAGQRDGQACARAYAFCEDLDDGSFRIAVAAKMNDADDSRVEGLLRHELAHAVLLHGGDMEHTERDADEVAEELFGSPLFYDDEDVQTTDQSAPGARHPRPAYLDGPDGRTLDSAEPMGEDGPDAPRGTMQLNTVEDVVSALDDAAAQGDAKTPRLIASQLSQQAKQVGGAQSRTLLTLAKAARHCATGVEARLDGQIDRAMTSERMCDAALQEAAMPRSRKNPEWAKKLGSGLYKGARYSAETAHDLYQGARAAHAARSAPAPVEPERMERKNPPSSPSFWYRYPSPAEFDDPDYYKVRRPNKVVVEVYNIGSRGEDDWVAEAGWAYVSLRPDGSLFGIRHGWAGAPGYVLPDAVNELRMSNHRMSKQEAQERARKIIGLLEAEGIPVYTYSRQNPRKNPAPSAGTKARRN